MASDAVTSRTTQGESEECSHVVAISRPYLMMNRYRSLAQQNPREVTFALSIRKTTQMVTTDVHNPDIPSEGNVDDYAGLITCGLMCFKELPITTTVLLHLK